MKILRIAAVAVAMFAAGSGYAAQSSNRIGVNGLTANRIGLNGLTTNVISPNRISPNRISPNRISPNRIGLNGISLNGAQPDDAFALRDALRVLARKPLAQ